VGKHGNGNETWGLLAGVVVVIVGIPGVMYVCSYWVLYIQNIGTPSYGLHGDEDVSGKGRRVVSEVVLQSKTCRVALLLPLPTLDM
jgi:hypothetical protein